MPRVNDLERQFGAKRRAKDRALLAEVERSIGAEPPRNEYKVSQELRDNITRAFGRTKVDYR